MILLLTCKTPRLLSGCPTSSSRTNSPWTFKYYYYYYFKYFLNQTTSETTVLTKCVPWKQNSLVPYQCQTPLNRNTKTVILLIKYLPPTSWKKKKIKHRRFVFQSKHHYVIINPIQGQNISWIFSDLTDCKFSLGLLETLLIFHQPNI